MIGEFGECLDNSSRAYNTIMNALWHENNKMPKMATLEQRLKWHIEHPKNCVCRKPPASVVLLIQ